MNSVAQLYTFLDEALPTVNPCFSTIFSPIFLEKRVSLRIGNRIFLGTSAFSVEFARYHAASASLVAMKKCEDLNSLKNYLGIKEKLENITQVKKLQESENVQYLC